MMLSHVFFECAGRLSPSDGARVWVFLAKFLENPTHPSINIERIHASDLWSARVSQGVRVILHKGPAGWTALYVGPHDEAYTFARRVNVVSIDGVRVVDARVVQSQTREATAEEMQAIAERALQEAREKARQERSYLLRLGWAMSRSPVPRDPAEIDRDVARMHAEGLSAGQISRRLAAEGTMLHRATVNRIVRRLGLRS